jgi:hypothetical protein
VRYHDLCYLLVTVNELVHENVPFSRIYGIDRDQTGSIDVDWIACSSTVCYLPNERFLAIAQRGGQVLRIGGGEAEFETFIDCQKGFKRKPGIMREVRCISGGRAYAVGTGRQVYRRDSAGVWKCIDKWSQIESKKLVNYSFESIDGFSDEDIYTVGWNGEIWHYNGRKWQQIDSPTNLSLHKVKCADDGMVYISGKEGILICGREKHWDIIQQFLTREDIWGLECFGGKLYASTLNLVYYFEGNDLKLVDYGEADIPNSCYHLSAADGIMWSIGEKDVMEFNGKAWKRII